ncbi:MAG: MFS transporter [Clostridiales Family XIII bacterium]|jgi:GPH family glycoside/pentoside/hexuronide:cation symporter|nr:MFS transporter [Clostridiales Family XIII bacterium]
MEKDRLPLTTKAAVGYSAASFTDAGLYNFIFMFLLYFLTDYARIGPAFAGTIILVATLCDIIITPVVSQISDNSRAKSRRRSFIKIAAIPIFIVFVLLFTTFDMGEGAKNAYYMILTVLFWIVFGTFVVPYYALAPELTDVQEERTKLRMPVVLFQAGGNIMGMVAPMAVMTWLVASGVSANMSWTVYAIIFGGMSAVALFVTYFTTKGREIEGDRLQRDGKPENVFLVYGRMCALKPARTMLSITAIYNLAYGFILSGMTYFILYNVVNGKESDVSIVTAVMTVILFVFTPVICSIAVKKERSFVLGACLFISAAAMLILFAIGIHTLPTLIVCMVLFEIANVAYWSIVQAMFYDLTEVYEYKYGKRMEGAACGINIVIMKVFMAISLQIFGIILEAGGYDPAAAAQTDAALKMIGICFIVIPAIMFVITGVVSLRVPITTKNYPLLLRALEAKRAGQEHSTEGLEKVL